MNETNFKHENARKTIYPVHFQPEIGAEIYLSDPAVRTLLEFFRTNDIGALKAKDRLEQWYDDWIRFQHEHGLYSTLLSPAAYSSSENGFDLLRYCRFLEVLAYCSPAHGYSLHVTFLGLFSVLMGSNEALKREAADALRAGNLLAFGVSEKDHGSDLLANEFMISDTTSGDHEASGSKYYIGNSDVASIISVLARKASAGRASRAPFMLFALRPAQSPAFRSLGKIRTLGVRAANVGAFEVSAHRFPQEDVIAEGREAWDAIFGTVTLGKFFLGFGSIGICEHALEEAVTHLGRRMLYGKAVIDMPHIRAGISQAYARLTAMKLYAYRALDYVHSASATDRRYLLYCAVQKARVSTEGVKVMALLQECIGARGFESDTYFEMALRDVQLIPSLEGSMHINLGLAAGFIPRYFDRTDGTLPEPSSVIAGETDSRENPYLTKARTGATHAIAFRPYLDAYRGLQALPNVASFVRQVETFRKVAARVKARNADPADSEITMTLGQCFATIAFGQLVAENLMRLAMPEELASAVFHGLVEDLSGFAIQLAALPPFDDSARDEIQQMIEIPKTRSIDWDFVDRQVAPLR
jgi:acyl-CoA dehydrogenase